jgi:PST family polysaccharide transporter
LTEVEKSTQQTQKSTAQNPTGFSGIAAKGVSWNVGLAAANKVVSLMGQVALVWLLTPAQMGMSGMALAMAWFGAFLAAGSVGDVLIQRGNRAEEAGQAIWVSLILSVLTAGLIAFMAPVSIWIGHPSLSGLLLLLAIYPLVDIPSPVLTAKLKSHFDFKHLAFSYFVAGTAYTGSALLLARAGMGAYSLVLPTIPRSLAFWLCVSWRTGMPPVSKPDFSKINGLMKPSIFLSFSSFLMSMQMQAPVFVVGLVLDATATGHFSWGWTAASQAVFLLAFNLQQVLMPVFVKMSHDAHRQVAATFKALRAITAMLMAIGGVQCLLGQALLDRFFPARWHAAGPVITWISLGMVFQGINICVSSWLNAQGKYRVLVGVNAVSVAFGSGMAFAGAKAGGVEGAAMGCGAGLALGALLFLLAMPADHAAVEVKKLLVPAFLSLSSLAGFRFLCRTGGNLPLIGICALAFFAANLLIWWQWDDGGLRGMVPLPLRKKMGLV